MVVWSRWPSTFPIAWLDMLVNRLASTATICRGTTRALADRRSRN